MTDLETVVLVHGTTEATLAPGRGGILTRLSVGGRAVLYLDEATLADPTKNVRGGNPVLFPSPGPLAGDRFTRDGRSGAMKQHGLARQRPWEVAARTASSVTLTLVGSASTAAEFPWSFALSFHYEVGDGRVRITERIENRDTAPMPYALGFHPYFHVPVEAKANVRIPTSATRAWDNVGKREVAVSGPIRIGEGEIDLHLVDHGRAEADLELGDGKVVRVSGSEAFGRWVIWSLPGKAFVCLEPWTAPADALGTGEGLRVVAPGRSEELWTEIALV